MENKQTLETAEDMSLCDLDISKEFERIRKIASQYADKLTKKITPTSIDVEPDTDLVCFDCGKKILTKCYVETYHKQNVSLCYCESCFKDLAID